MYENEQGLKGIAQFREPILYTLLKNLKSIEVVLMLGSRSLGQSGEQLQRASPALEDLP